jgi:hypothetical protein
VSETGGYKALYILGNASTPEINMDWYNEGIERIIVIGTTIAELFVDKLHTKLSKRVLEIEQFKYKDRFIIIPVKDKKQVVEISKRVVGDGESTTRRPLMILTGSKRSQKTVVEKMGGGGGAHQSRNERELGQKWNWLVGGANVFYQNSVISRGIDVEQYNVLMVHDCNFAQPYWAVEDRNIANAILADETTNSILRISPTSRRDPGTTKMIVMAEDDLWKVNYIRDQIMDLKATEDTEKEDFVASIANMIKRTSMTGASQISNDMSTISIKSMGTTMGMTDIRNKILSSKDEVSEDELADAVRKIESMVVKTGTVDWFTMKEMKEMINLPGEIVKAGLSYLYMKGVLKNKKYQGKERWKFSRKN